MKAQREKAREEAAKYVGLTDCVQSVPCIHLENVKNDLKLVELVYFLLLKS